MDTLNVFIYVCNLLIFRLFSFYIGIQIYMLSLLFTYEGILLLHYN